MHSLRQALEDVEGVTLIHDIHAWTITLPNKGFPSEQGNRVLSEEDFE